MSAINATINSNESDGVEWHFRQMLRIMAMKEGFINIESRREK
jgi:hypothetical protein